MDIMKHNQVLMVVKGRRTLISVIPAKAGIQGFQAVTKPLDTRFRGYDDILRSTQVLKFGDFLPLDVLYCHHDLAGFSKNLH